MIIINYFICNGNEGRIKWAKKFEICLLVVLVCFVVGISGCTSSSVKVVVNYTGGWNGTITDSSGTRTIEGNGDQTIDLGSITGSVKAKVQKKDNSTDTLIISIVSGDKTVETMNTSTPNGYTITSVYLTS